MKLKLPLEEFRIEHIYRKVFYMHLIYMQNVFVFWPVLASLLLWVLLANDLLRVSIFQLTIIYCLLLAGLYTQLLFLVSIIKTHIYSRNHSNISQMTDLTYITIKKKVQKCYSGKTSDTSEYQSIFSYLYKFFPPNNSVFYLFDSVGLL